MIAESLERLASLFSRRFFFNALLPTFVFGTAIAASTVGSWWSFHDASAWWDPLDLLTRLLVVLGYLALVYFLAAGVASQWRNIVRLFEGYPVAALARRLGRRPPGQRWHGDRMVLLNTEQHGDPARAYYRYPQGVQPEAVLPTRLGNILLAGERYADDRYGIDTIYFWTRLYPLLPEAFQREYEAALTQYQFPLVVAFQSAVSAVVCSATLLSAHVPALMFAGVLGAGMLLAYSAYALSLSSAIEMAELQRTAFDLYRGQLLLAWPTVADIADEKVAFAKIKAFVVAGAPPRWDEEQERHRSRHRPAIPAGPIDDVNGQGPA